MPLFRFLTNLDPQSISATFANYVRAIVNILLWTVIGFASLSAAFLAFSMIWLAVKFAMETIGI
jgi:hypothetical protein